MGTGTILRPASPATLAITHCRLSHFRRHVRASNPFLSPLTLLTPNRPSSISVPKRRLQPSVFRSRAAAFNGSAPLLQDAGAAGIVMVGAYALVSTFDHLIKRNLIEQSLSRKVVHILSGLLFMGSWPIFSISSEARYFASLVPLLNCFRLVVHGLSLATDEGLTNSVTREGNPKELLRGPLYYVIILILCALIFWRESPVGVISLAMMCGGDGAADIIGRRFGSVKIPYNQQKSWAGSISMFIVGFLISMGAGILSVGLGLDNGKSRLDFFGGNFGGVPSNYWGCGR